MRLTFRRTHSAVDTCDTSVVFNLEMCAQAPKRCDSLKSEAACKLELGIHLEKIVLLVFFFGFFLYPYRGGRILMRAAQCIEKNTVIVIMASDYPILPGHPPSLSILILLKRSRPSLPLRKK